MITMTVNMKEVLMKHLASQLTLSYSIFGCMRVAQVNISITSTGAASELRAQDILLSRFC